MREKNVFEKIIDGEIPSSKVLESNDFLAFHDINPQAPVHILIIPKKFFKDFSEVDGETMSKMTDFIHEVAKVMGLDKSGYRLLTNCGRDSGQEIFHLHFHMLGGLKLSSPKNKTNRDESMF